MILFEATGRAVVPFAQINWDLRLTTLTLVGVMFVGAVVIAVTAQWRKKTRSGELSPSEQLAEYRALYLEGGISKEEFEQLRAVLGGEMRRQLHVPPATKPSVAPEAIRPEVPRPLPAEEKPAAPEPPDPS